MQIQQRKSSSTSKNFIDPDTNCHTQTIEGFWSVIKRKLRKQGTNIGSENDILSKIYENQYRKKYSEQCFNKLIEHIALFYS